MLIEIVSVLLIGLLGYGVYWLIRYRKKVEVFEKIIGNLIQSNDDMRNTLVTGLYHRFKVEEGTEETPIDFEYFITTTFERYFGGSANVTPPSGDFGVDVEHKRHDGLYLGQVKCYDSRNKVDYTPIAVIHS